ncbi:MAG: HAD family phosphatase [Fusobacteriaceae bacterium]|jgi:HAD superfamily hydrolase (TIGR01509 family)|nr:HAD family phosphatase [Fusobacteriaceae bacterium]
MIKLRGAVFDADGTLLDSMAIWKDLGAMFLRKRGVEAEAGLSQTLQALEMAEVAAYLKKTYGLPGEIPQILEEITDMVREFYAFTVEAKPGVLPFLAKLKARGIPMCIATSNFRWLLAPALERCGISAYIPDMFTAVELETGKAEPLIFDRARERLGTLPGETVVFEDAPYAMRTAKNAGYQVVAVYDDWYRDAREEIEGLADAAITTFDETEGIFDV